MERHLFRGQSIVGFVAEITAGSPWENGHVESFHASLRGEFLNRELLFSVKEIAVEAFGAG